MDRLSLPNNLQLHRPLSTGQHIHQELIPDGIPTAIDRNDGITGQDSRLFGWRVVLNNTGHDWLGKDGRLFILEIVDSGKKNHRQQNVHYWPHYSNKET